MINIKTPCNENWNEFSPTKQGAFCKKCEIDVVDFSVKSNNEIKSFFLEHAGQQMCGRFKQSQIDDFNISFYDWDGQTKQTFQAKFVLTLLIVFGLTLFSCSNSKDIPSDPNQNNNLLTEIESDSNNSFKSTDSVFKEIYSKTNNPFENPIVNNNDILNRQNIITTNGYGGTERISTEPLIGSTEIDFIYGDFIINPKETICLQKPDSYSHNVKPSLNKIVPIYPNYTSQIIKGPNSNFSTLLVNSKYSEKFAINIHNSKGQLIKYVNNDVIELGINTFSLNLTEYHQGDYYVVIASQTTHEIITFTIF